ncbi:synaptic vesicle glycoprotein 2B-like [Contarinia nasturtii]|uniref:synaptic vesicle glycoprotein 2B-like n=1 Tax=Contarinia nasturtii TaxID=265458 RepID=UPI0012D45F21|nr:synaptic vesicle glycoprotein 2B-like [Contarinia nasturtii]
MCQIAYLENGCEKVQTMPNDPPSKKISMDEAISKTNFGCFNYIVIVLSGMILFSVLMETSAIAFILPVSQCDLNLTTSEKGILAAASLFGTICSSHLWGFLSDTKGRRAIIQPTLFLAFFCSICSSLVQNFYILSTLRFLNGFFVSGFSATIYAYLGEFHNNIQRNRAILAASVIFGISCISIPLAAGSVINQDWQFYVPLLDITYKPWRLYFVVCSSPGFIAALILIFLPESPKFVLGQGKSTGAYQILRKMHRLNNGRKVEFEVFEIDEEKESIENRKQMMDNKQSRYPLLKSIWTQTTPLFKPPYLRSTLLMCAIQFGIYWTNSGFFMFFAEILNKMAVNSGSSIDHKMMMCDIINMKSVNNTAIEIRSTQNQVCFSKLDLSTVEQGIILEIIFAFGQVMVGLLINRVGKFPLLFFILVVSGLGGIGCMLTDISYLQRYLFIVHFTCGVAGSIINAAIVEIYPTSLRAMAICISLMMFGRLGGVVGTNVIASLLERNCESVFYLSGVNLIVIGVLAFFIPNIHQRVSKSS